MLEQVGIKWPESPKKAWQRRSRRDAHRDHRVVKDETMVTVVQDNSGIRTTRHAVFSRPGFGTFKRPHPYISRQ